MWSHKPGKGNTLVQYPLNYALFAFPKGCILLNPLNFHFSDFR
jgi:hypothetical protein